MISRLFTVVCALALIPCLGLLLAAVWSYFADVRWAVQLLGGVEVSPGSQMVEKGTMLSIMAKFPVAGIIWALLASMRELP